MTDDDAIATMLRRARIAETDDEGSQQFARLRGLKGETLDRVHRFQQPGITHNPPADAEGWLLSLGGRGDRAVFFGGESEEKRPRATEVGGTVIYDMNGSAVSLVLRDLRIVHASKIVLKAPEVVVDAPVIKLGSEGATRPAGMLGSVDDAGHALAGALATKVLVE